jgi:hypothetical protein
MVRLVMTKNIKHFGEYVTAVINLPFLFRLTKRIKIKLKKKKVHEFSVLLVCRMPYSAYDISIESHVAA